MKKKMPAKKATKKAAPKGKASRAVQLEEFRERFMAKKKMPMKKGAKRAPRDEAIARMRKGY